MTSFLFQRVEGEPLARLLIAREKSVFTFNDMEYVSFN